MADPDGVTPGTILRFFDIYLVVLSTDLAPYPSGAMRFEHLVLSGDGSDRFATGTIVETTDIVVEASERLL